MSVKIRKTVLDQQGRIVEEYEGSEEEIAAYEAKKAKRAQTEGAKKQRTVLHGKDLEDIRRTVREELDKLPSVQLVPIYVPAAPAPILYPQVPQPLPWWSPSPVQPWITFSATGTAILSDEIGYSRSAGALYSSTASVPVASGCWIQPDFPVVRSCN